MLKFALLLPLTVALAVLFMGCVVIAKMFGLRHPEWLADALVELPPRLR